ncbi:hypothetical protein HY450_02445 [Candidatus Pacearchaeota archaeon]|nr:hypothetical protein [Candidatus Pacearchaeota archaeon]
MSKLFVSIVLFVFLISGVFALGVTPGRTTFDYEPGTQRKVDFSVVNSEKDDINIVVLVQGELNESISLSEVSFSMSSSEQSRNLRYILDMPQNLAPGAHSSEIVILQLPGRSSVSDAFVGGTVAVVTEVVVFVPYPGKYAEAGLNIIGPENGKVTFVIPVTSRGDLDLVRVGGTIDIFSSLNEKIATVSTNEISILSKERKEIVAEWDASSIQPGPYRAVATVIYDEQVLKVEKEFNVGERRLGLEGIEVNDFSLGEIAKFEILVENKWSQEIKGAYAEMQVFNSDGEIMAEFKSPTQDIPALSKALMISFWDTEGVRKGTYDSTLFLRYGASSEQQSLKLEISENDINVVGVGYVISESSGGKSSGGLTTILIAGIIILVLVNLSWFLFFRRKLKHRQ